MNNSNMGYPPPPNYDPPYPPPPPPGPPPRPRFGASVPSMYPRPASSASKPNHNGPDYDPEPPRESLDSSTYFSCEESFSESPAVDSFGQQREMVEYPIGERFGIGNLFTRNHGGESFRQGPGKPKKKFPRNKSFNPKHYKIPQGLLKCELCILDFQSQVALDAHLQGAKHAKKLKAADAMAQMQAHGRIGEFNAMGESFKCEICKVVLNSSLQLQTHLDGSKHRSKSLKQMEEQKTEEDADQQSENNNETAEGKRPAPDDFEEPDAKRPSPYYCFECCLCLNSQSQLDQHLQSKRHTAKAMKRTNARIMKQMTSVDPVESPPAAKAESPDRQSPGDLATGFDETQETI